MTASDDLDDLRVVGFHGVVGDRQTPARCAPVHVTRDGCFVAVHRLTDGTIEREESDKRYDDASVSGQYTHVDPDLEAHLDWVFIVVGDRERNEIERLQRGGSYVTRWIVGAVEGRPVDVEVRTIGRNVALYFPPGDAAKAWSELGRAARTSLDEACERGESELIEDAAWWLKNAAADRDDVLRALAGLTRAGSRHVRGLARTYFPEVDVNELHAQIAEVVKTLPSSRTTAAHLPPAGWTAGVRDPVRKPFQVQWKAA